MLPASKKEEEESASVVRKSDPEQQPKQERPRTPDSASMADAEAAPAAAAENEAVQEDEDKEYVPSLPARRSYKYDDPPIIFRDVDVGVFLSWSLFSVNFIIHFFFSRVRPLCRKWRKW